jgi:predicted aldo/keto reductase-like oxidoreductase
MRFPRTWAGIDLGKTEELILTGVQGGINYFDTAYLYPGSEEALGLILEKHRLREQVYLATKMPLLLIHSPEDFDFFFQKQLRRLRTGYVDYYLLHMLTDTRLWEDLQALGIEAWLAGKKQAGLIKQAGFSFHGPQGEFLRLLGVYPWDFCQIQYNYAGEHYQAGTLGLERAGKDLPVIVMEPLLGGKLGDKLPPRAAEVFRKANPAKTPAAWALEWIWDHPEVTVLLSGMSDRAQVLENLKTADSARPGSLPAEAGPVYAAALAVFNQSYKIPCTGCHYCMPCPRNVNIPGCFAAYNASFAWGFFRGMQQYITGTGLAWAGKKGAAPASFCIQCRQCEASCPQRLAIPEALKTVRKRLEPFWITLAFKGIRRVLQSLGRAGKKPGPR